MYACPECDRAYATQNSLKRHLNNHSVNQNGYRCPLCDLAFSRRDLMLRHKTIHGSTPRATRRRIHTACKECRVSHEKCTGGDPCDVCRARDQVCTYKPRSGRVSQPVTSASIATDSTEQPSNEEIHDVQQKASELETPQDVYWLGSDPPAFPSMELNLLGPAVPADSSDTTDMVQRDIPFGGVDRALMCEYLDTVLPDLWDITAEDNGLAPNENHLTGVMSDCGTADYALWSGVENMPYPLMESDFFQSSFTLLDNNDYPSIPDKNIPPVDGRLAPQRVQELPTHKDMMVHQPLTPNSSSAGTEDLESTIRVDKRQSWKERGSRQKKLVGELVDHVIAAPCMSPAERRSHWSSVSADVCREFELRQPPNPQHCLLVEMAHLYRQNILPIWPMICESGLEDPTSMHPVLFLVAVSIGAMYLDENSSVFGTLMHERLRTSLVTSFIEGEIADSDTIWLAQARNTIQVVALYFARGQELTYAEHLGAVLVSQARRMKLFKRSPKEEFAAANSAGEQVAVWIAAETRRRVAFGIFRADVFLSLLLNCPPSISADEMEIALPYPDTLWHSIGKLSTTELLAALEHERTKRDETPFCDLLRILLDRDEALLDMEMRHYELLLFGLQAQVWTFSHDPDIYQRLIGQAWQERDHPESLDLEISRVLNHSSAHSRDQLQLNHRKMRDLINDRSRLAMALEKWSKSFNASRSRPGHQDRSATLSSLLLFHIHHLNLNTPLHTLHGVAEGLCSDKSVDRKELQTSINWAHTSQARKAAHHASKIWSLLDNEARMNPTKKARYNMLSFLGLYHTSVVLWTCFGARRDSNRSFDEGSNNTFNSSAAPRSSEIMSDIASLYRRLKCMNWDVYAGSVQRLLSYEFPGG